jgi:ATP-dependent RNA helicase SUPV3L1/SUV3
MSYKIIEKNEDTFFKYSPVKNYKKTLVKKPAKENVFGVLRNFNFN